MWPFFFPYPFPLSSHRTSCPFFLFWLQPPTLRRVLESAPQHRICLGRVRPSGNRASVCPCLEELSTFPFPFCCIQSCSRIFIYPTPSLFPIPRTHANRFCRSFFSLIFNFAAPWGTMFATHGDGFSNSLPSFPALKATFFVFPCDPYAMSVHLSHANDSPFCTSSSGQDLFPPSGFPLFPDFLTWKKTAFFSPLFYSTELVTFPAIVLRSITVSFL